MRFTDLHVIILGFILAGSDTSVTLRAALKETGNVLSAADLTREMSTLSGEGAVTGTAKKWAVSDAARQQLASNAPTSVAPVAPVPLAEQIQPSINLNLGAFVWWDLENSRITPADLRAALQNEGLLTLTKGDKNLIYVPDIPALPAIRTACTTWTEGRSNGVAKFKAEVVKEDSGKVLVGILSRVKKSDTEVGWDQVDTLVFDLQSQDWTSPGVIEQAISFRKIADDERKFLNHRFIRPELIERELSGMASVRLKRSGGFYFVRHGEKERLARLKRIMGCLPGAVLQTVNVGDDARAAVASGFRETILDQITEVQATLQGWRDNAGKRKIRSDAADNTIGELADLLSKAELYQSVLSVSMQDLEEEIKACQEEAGKLLGLTATA